MSEQAGYDVGAKPSVIGFNALVPSGAKCKNSKDRQVLRNKKNKI